MDSLGAAVLGDDELRVSDSHLYYVSPTRRFYAHARPEFSDDPRPPAVDFERAIRLPDAPLRVAANHWMICFLFAGGRFACWNHEHSTPRRQPLALARGEVATSLAVGRDCVAVGTAAGSVSVFGQPYAEGHFDPASWRSSAEVRLIGARGAIDDVAIVNYAAYAISGDSLSWWHHRSDDSEPRARPPEYTCSLRTSGLRLVTSYESSSEICVQDAAGRYACHADPYRLCELANTRFR